MSMWIFIEGTIELWSYINKQTHEKLVTTGEFVNTDLIPTMGKLLLSDNKHRYHYSKGEHPIPCNEKESLSYNLCFSKLYDVTENKPYLYSLLLYFDNEIYGLEYKNFIIMFREWLKYVETNNILRDMNMNVNGSDYDEEKKIIC